MWVEVLDGREEVEEAKEEEDGFEKEMEPRELWNVECAHVVSWVLKGVEGSCELRLVMGWVTPGGESIYTDPDVTDTAAGRFLESKEEGRGCGPGSRRAAEVETETRRGRERVIGIWRWWLHSG